MYFNTRIFFFSTSKKGFSLLDTWIICKKKKKKKDIVILSSAGLCNSPVKDYRTTSLLTILGLKVQKQELLMS